ncbi:MAG: hypothetical protein JWN30_2646, partial [Bacilli bacterium]|nr:hypothetical protein [Bacilli bacterium]
AHFYRNHYRKLTRKSVALLVILGIVSSGTTIFYYEALQFVSSSIGIVLLFQFTWMVVVIDSVVTRVMPSMRQWLSVLLILIGTICAVKLQGQGAASGAAPGLSGATIGYLLGLLSAATYAVYLVLLERVHTDTPPVVNTSIMVLTSLVIAIAVFPAAFAEIFSMVVHPKPGMPGVIGLLTWTSLIAVFGQVIPPLLFNRGIPVIGGAAAGILGAMELPVGMIASLFLVHEQIVLLQWLGIVLILAGILLPGLGRRRGTAS